MSSSVDLSLAVKAILQELDLDLRAEILVTDLVSRGFELEDFFVRPVGLFRRRFGKDVAKYEEVIRPDHETIYCLDVNREGLYDALPQSIFHYPASKPKPFKTSAEMVQEVRKRVEEEKNAREFFLVYEAEFFRQRVSVEWHERKLLDTITHDMHDREFLSYWDFPDYFDTRQKGILFYLMPAFHRIRSDFRLMQATYSCVLKDEVIIRNSGIGSSPIAHGLSSARIGRSVLSWDSYLGGVSKGIYETIDVRVNLSSVDRIPLYLPGAVHRQVIEYLNYLFMPFNLEADITIATPVQDWNMQASAHQFSRLGFSTTL